MLDIASLNSSLGSIAKLVRLMEQNGVTASQLLLPISDRSARRNLADYLKAGCPQVDAALQPARQKPSVLKLINADLQLDAIASYDPKELTTRKGLWVSDEFISRVRSKAKPVENFGPLSLNSRELVKNAYDREITPELGGSYTFDESELCARIEQMIAKQSNGEEGDLLNNSYANIFYLAGCVVSVSWNEGNGEWGVDAWGLGGGDWGAGLRVFSRN